MLELKLNVDETNELYNKGFFVKDGFIIVAENKNEFYIGKLDIDCGVIIRLNSEEDD